MNAVFYFFRATDEEVQQHLATATVKRSMLGSNPVPTGQHFGLSDVERENISYEACSYFGNPHFTPERTRITHAPE